MSTIEFVEWLGVKSTIVAVYTCLLPLFSTWLLSYMVPKVIIDKYLRSPWFHDGDAERFNHFPFRYYLTLWLAQYTASRWFANRRKIQTIRQDSPRYWVVLSFVYFWGTIMVPVAAFILAAFSAVVIHFAA